MKKILCISFLHLVFVSSLSAKTLSDGKSINLGIQTYFHAYEEPGVMKQDGFFLGLSYSFEREKQFYFYGVEGIASLGLVDYTSESSGSMDNKKDGCIDTRGIIGKTLVKTGNTDIKVFSGLAYRYFRDDSAGMQTTTGHSGYLRVSNYLYSPFGIRGRTSINNVWSLSMDAEYDFFWFGIQKSYLGSLSGYDDIENDQKEGKGYRFSVGLIRKEKLRVYKYQIFYRYWDIEDSEVTRDSSGRSWIEPYNDTREIGLNISILF